MYVFFRLVCELFLLERRSGETLKLDGATASKHVGFHVLAEILSVPQLGAPPLAPFGRGVNLPLGATAWSARKCIVKRVSLADVELYNLTRQLGRGANLPWNATAWSVRRLIVGRVSLVDVTIDHPTR